MNGEQVNKQKKNLYIVVGMPRSGTSAITRGLKALGIDLGDNFGSGNNKWNPTGFWEDKDIVYKINRGVSFALNDNWMSVHLIDDQCRNNPVLSDLKLSATHILQKRLASTSSWGFKDPRTSRVLPFWQEVFAELHLSDNYIIALRNPLACASSWRRLSGADIEIGLLLWLIHLIPVINCTHGRNRLMVSYDLLMQNPRQQLARIKDKLGIQSKVDPSDVDQYANYYLDKKLSHYEYSEEDLKSHPAVAIAPICAHLYELFMKLAKDEIAFESEAFSSTWQTLKAEFDKVYPGFAYINSLLKKNKQLERKLRTIERSVPWKLIYPLRVLDDALRALRRKTREQRRLIKSYD